MTQTNDPPLISSLELIPDAAEKADLDAPNDSGGKLVIGQAPNITITETTVVADAAERLALDVQEGDVAIQQNVSSSFIFTGGDNIAPNWQTIDFDAVGAIDSEDISPNNIAALGDISGQDVTASGNIDGGTFANADLSAASNGELLSSDGSGNLQFTSPPSSGFTAIDSSNDVGIYQFLQISQNQTPPPSQNFDPNKTQYIEFTSPNANNRPPFLTFTFTDGSKTLNFDDPNDFENKMRDRFYIFQNLISISIGPSNDFVRISMQVLEY